MFPFLPQDNLGYADLADSESVCQPLLADLTGGVQRSNFANVIVRESVRVMAFAAKMAASFWANIAQVFWFWYASVCHPDCVMDILHGRAPFQIRKIVVLPISIDVITEWLKSIGASKTQKNESVDVSVDNFSIFPQANPQVSSWSNMWFKDFAIPGFALFRSNSADIARRIKAFEVGDCFPLLSRSIRFVRHSQPFSLRLMFRRDVRHQPHFAP